MNLTGTCPRGTKFRNLAPSAAVVKAACDATGLFQIEVPVSTQGAFQVEVEGSVGNKTHKLDYVGIFDSIPPLLSLDGDPSPETPLVRTPTIGLSGSCESGASVFADGGERTTCVAGRWTLPSLPIPGLERTITVTARDAAGNTA